MAILDFDFSLRLRAFALSLALTVERETLALVGPSGAGKTTALRAIAGLVNPDRGRITLDGRTWFDADTGTSLPPEERSVGLVFQDYALFPHMSVRDNIAFGERRGSERTDELIERFRISHLAETRPGTLSGGERQRVALARALVRDPDVLLLDEPLSALDAHTRAVVSAELHDLLAELRLPTIFITHDFRDAAALATRAGVLVDGRVRQLGPVGGLAERPTDAFVAALTGNNLLAAESLPGSDGRSVVRIESGQKLTVDRSAQIDRATSGRVGVVIAPWQVKILPGDAPAESLPPNAITGTVTALTPAGNRVELRIGPVRCECSADDASRLGLREGGTAWAVLARDAIHLVPLDATR